MVRLVQERRTLWKENNSLPLRNKVKIWVVSLKLESKILGFLQERSKSFSSNTMSYQRRKRASSRSLHQCIKYTMNRFSTYSILVQLMEVLKTKTWNGNEAARCHSEMNWKCVLTTKLTRLKSRTFSSIRLRIPKTQSIYLEKESKIE